MGMTFGAGTAAGTRLLLGARMRTWNARGTLESSNFTTWEACVKDRAGRRAQGCRMKKPLAERPLESTTSVVDFMNAGGIQGRHRGGARADAAAGL